MHGLFIKEIKKKKEKKRKTVAYVVLNFDLVWLLRKWGYPSYLPHFMAKATEFQRQHGTVET